MTTQPDRLREALDSAIIETRRALHDGNRVDVRFLLGLLERCDAALAEAAPAPDPDLFVTIPRHARDQMEREIVRLRSLAGEGSGASTVYPEDGQPRATLDVPGNAGPAPDLRAAVEEFIKKWRSSTRSEPSMSGPTYVIPAGNIPVIFAAVDALNDARLVARSAPASREAGLDAERLARALHAFYAGKDTRYEFFPADCEHPEDARIIAVAYASDDPNDAIAAEYARLASPAPAEKPEPK